MATTYPVALDDFFRGLGVVQAKFYPTASMVGNTTGEGEIVTVSRGLARWAGEVTVRPGSHADIAALTAKMHLLSTDPDASFMVTDFRRKGPSKDDLGCGIGSSVVSLDAIAANNRDLDISGMPAGYQLTAGDLIAFEYGSPARFALHEVVQTASSDLSGAIAGLEVLPPLRPGATVSTQVNLVNPSCRAKVVPGSYTPPTQEAALSTGFSFSWRQSIK